MSGKDINSYRFNSGEEPTDEMLAQIMHEVAVEAAESNKRAATEHLEEMMRDIARKKAKWGDRIREVAENG